jgi:MoaA/NifB/PqqE/SkfB family radical SAM enzyme
MIIINLTKKCNLRCKTCLREEYGSEKDLSFTIFKKLLNELKQMSFSEISITGGEPCLHNEFEKYISYAVSLNIGVAFISNGTLMDKYAFLFKKYRKHIKGFYISIDGATKKTHESIRINGNFEKSIDSLKFLIKKKSIPQLLFVFVIRTIKNWMNL